MSKSLQLLVIYALLVVLAQSPSSLEAEKIPFNSLQTQFNSEESKSNEDLIYIRVDCISHKDVVIGFKGTFVFKTLVDEIQQKIFEAENIEQETTFKTTMKEKSTQNNIDISCRLWKPSETIMIICEGNFYESGQHNVEIESKYFNYKNQYLVRVEFYGTLSFNQMDKNYPFLYSYPQSLYIFESKSSYELKFKFNSYYDEILYIYGNNHNYAVLDNCQKNYNYFLCQISKEKIEEILVSKNEKFNLGSMSDTLGKIDFNYVYPITINYEDVQKKDIYINLQRLVGGVTEIGTPFAFETDVITIPNFISGSELVDNGIYCYFKKMTGKPLMLFVDYSFEGDDILLPFYTREIILREIHYKYNFIVHPNKFYETISIKDKGTNVFLSYPEKIDFDSTNYPIIKYIMDNPSLAKEIKLNPNSNSYLVCEDLNGMKKCTVPESHFNGMKKGDYNTHHKNHAGAFNIYYTLPSIYVTLPEIIYINFADNQGVHYIGYQGFFNLVLDYENPEIFNEKDIEEKTTFETTIRVDNTDRIEVTCKLWKPINEKLNMFCKLNSNLKYGSHSFFINTSSFSFNNKKYKIMENERTLSLYQLKENIPFLYSSSQTLNIDERTETYDLKFKIGKYDNQQIFMKRDSDLIVLDDCTVMGKELICKIKKDVIEEYASYNGEKLSVSYFMLDEENIVNKDLTFYSIYGIYISYNLNKKDISVEITKLLQNNIQKDNFIPYETNVKDITNVNSKKFTLTLSNMKKIECFLKKSEGLALIMLCHLEVDEFDEFSLGEIRTKTRLSDINIKYNFIIEPINNNEKCRIEGLGSYIIFNLPKVLNFTSHKSITIDFAIKNSNKSPDIKLNPEADNLECYNLSSIHKRCQVPRIHFRNKNTGYFYTHHSNNKYESIIFYESSPFKVILSENEVYLSINKKNNKDKIIIGNEGVFAMITDYNDKEKRIFDKNDNINFIGILNCTEREYSINCRLWVPQEDNLRIICKFNQNLHTSSIDMLLKDHVIEYKNYVITIEKNEKILFGRYKGYYPFLYSDRQTINIEDTEEKYELKFNVETYNNEFFYIYGSYNNFAILDNCETDFQQFKCTITKVKIEEILTRNNEQFKIGLINDNIGIIPLEHILNITISVEKIQKEDIFMRLTKIVGGISEIGTPFAYETNITNFPNFISEVFTDIFYIKKISGRPLMLFCVMPDKTDILPIRNSSQTMHINDAHYKYNFIILPQDISGTISIKNEGERILLTYPEKLDFSSNEKLTIRYIIDDQPNSENKLKLNPNAQNELECIGLDRMKKCNVYMSHFDGQKSGDFDTLYLNHERKFSIYYDSSRINVHLPYETVSININYEDNKYNLYVGNKGMFLLKSKYNDIDDNIFDDVNIEENTKFTLTFLPNNSYSRDIPCHLWKNTNGTINIFCKLNENFNKGNNSIEIPDANFNYKKYKIRIKSLSKLYIYQYEETLPFLYSKSQTINIVKGVDTYYLKFKIGCYNNEKLLIAQEYMGYIFLDKCSNDKKELTCQIERSQLEEIHFHAIAAYIPILDIMFIEFPMIDKFIVNYGLEKKDLPVKIGRLFESHFDINNFFAYEVTYSGQTPNLVSDKFELNFKNETHNNIPGMCFFKSTTENYLYLLCIVEDKEGTISLSEIREEKKLTNIHIKYNFYIEPVKNDEEITLRTSGSAGIFIIPQKIDFYTKDEITVDLFFIDPTYVKGVRLDYNADKDLVCEDKIEYGPIKRCIVTKNHFKQQKNKNYCIYHLNHKNKYIQFYELSPMQVIFPNEEEILIRIQKEDNKNGVRIGKDGIFSFITDYNDTQGIFDDSNIKNIKIKANIRDDYGNEFKANCRLWEPKEEKLRIICKLDSNLKYSKQNIIMDQITIEGDILSIVIRQIDYIAAIQYNYDIPFLYSDKRNIKVDLRRISYDLKFNVESYYNDILYIYGDNLNYEILDKCVLLNNKELNCEMSLEKIEGIMELDKSTFKIGTMNDNIGIIPLDAILDITFIYPKIDKEDIYLGLTKFINPNPDTKTYFGFETNITKISDKINTIQFGDGKIFRFKKTAGNPLMMLGYLNSENFAIFNTDSEMILDDIHYRYNFRIQPFKNAVQFNNSFYPGTNIKLLYPENLDFTNNDSLTIRYIMDNPNYSKNLKLNYYSRDVICEDLEGMKKCTVHKDHFIGERSGYFRTYYSNHEKKFLEYYESSDIKVIIPKEKSIEIFVSDEENNQLIEIGDNGIIYFISKYEDLDNIFNITDIEEKTEFNSTITDSGLNDYETTCRLWKPADETIRIFCKLNKTIDYSNIRLNSATFTYNGHKIDIISRMNFGMKISQFKTKFPFIYADKQTIKVEKTNNSYELKFKFLEYQNEQLILLNDKKVGEEELNNMILDSCNINGKEIKCQITREKIEQILGYSGQEFKISYMDYNRGQLVTPNNILKIVINYNSIEQEDVYIRINSLIEDKIGTQNYIAYETNITSLDNIISNKFQLDNVTCLLKKDTEKPLLMICKLTNRDLYIIPKITEKVELSHINIKYNLIILPRTVEDKITINYSSGNFLFATPMELNFLKHDQIFITYYINKQDKPEFYNDIRINLDSAQDLICEVKNNIATCLVSRNHFNGKTTGYYYTYHKNNLAQYSISYELATIKVILPDRDETMIRLDNIDEKSFEKIGQKGAISFITEYDDSQNIFNISDIEAKTANKISFSSNNKNYTADCRLWKPKKEKLRLICHFNENIDAQKLILNRYTFKYNENKISLISKNDLNIKQLNSAISLLYSDKQVINIIDTQNEYNLVFKEEIYNKEPLLLNKVGNNRQNIYLSCVEENKEIKCTINKDKLVGILSKSGEKFFLSQVTESAGILKFENVFDITINYDKVVKKNIKLSLTKLLTQSVEKNNYIVFETNIAEEIPVITTDYFKLNPNKNDLMSCLFKKNNNQKDDKLFLLCDADTPGVYKFNVSETDLNDLNILYSFKILEAHINENVNVSDKEGTKILSVYPDSLDFTSHDKLTIKYQTENPEKLKDIKLNTSSTSNLECRDNNGYKECDVPQNHFNISGNYYTSYTNSLGNKVTSYEISRIKVTVKQEEKKSSSKVGLIVGCVVGGVVLIAVIIIIVVVVIKKKKANEIKISDKTEGILPDSAVELKEGIN